MNLTSRERIVLDRIQRHFPLTEEPFSAMAGELQMDEGDLIDVIVALRDAGIVRCISGIFSAAHLGFTSALVAFRVDGPLERAASTVSAHPGVGHNYERDHRYNLWFTLAAVSEEALKNDAGLLAERSGAAEFLVLRSERVLKLRVHLGMGTENDRAVHEEAKPAVPTRAPRELSADEREAVRLLQIDLPTERSPFAALAARGGSHVTAGDLVAIARSLHDEGVMRRYSAVLRHRRAGYAANAMTAWRPGPGADIDGIARIFSSRPAVSHLYLRTIHPGRWEHPLFAMIHARSEEELLRIIADCAAETGIGDYLVLRTLREFKKERVVYEPVRFNEWERQSGS